MWSLSLILSKYLVIATFPFFVTCKFLECLTDGKSKVKNAYNTVLGCSFLLKHSNILTMELITKMATEILTGK